MKKKNIIGIAFITFTLMFAGIAVADREYSTKHSSDEHGKYDNHEKHDGHDDKYRHDDHEKDKDDDHRKNESDSFISRIFDREFIVLIGKINEP